MDASIKFIQQLAARLLQVMHSGCVDAFYFYRQVMQYGWFEALEHSQPEVEVDGCPVKNLLKVPASNSQYGIQTHGE